jgi:hypothetical protein
MTISVYDKFQWKIPKAIYVWDSNVSAWSETTQVAIYANGDWQTVHNTAVITSNVTNANLYTIMGSPTVPLNVKVTVNPGVAITSVNANVASFSIGGFPAGSRIYLVNNGTIQGATGNAGWPGGNALVTTTSMLINNNGTIAGGAANAIVSRGTGYYLVRNNGATVSFEDGGTLLGLLK